MCTRRLLMPLTDAAIKALQPREKRYSVTDDRGLSLEVYPTGGRLWQFRFSINGRPGRVTLGRYPAISLKAARQLRDQAATLVALGKSPAEEKRKSKEAPPESVTVTDFGERFFKEVVVKERKDPTIPRRYFDKAIVPAIGSKPVREVSTEDVREIIWRKKAEGFDAAAGQIRGLLKRLFDYAVTCGIATANPVLALPMRHVHKAKARDRALSPGEIGTFLAAVHQSNIRRQFKAGLHIILLTMVRKSELLLAHWEHVDLDKGEWAIPTEHSKTSKPHIVYLSRQAIAAFRVLRSLSAGSALVLPGRGSLTKPFAHNAINTALKVALQGQDIPVFTVHDLRRTASTLLHENGWPSDVVEKALNHSVGGVRGIYNRAEYSSQRKEMLQYWADYIDDQLAHHQNQCLAHRKY